MGVGKFILFGMIVCNVKVDINVIGLVGECGCEVKDFLCKDFGEDGLCKSVIVVVILDESYFM